MEIIQKLNKLIEENKEFEEILKEAIDKILIKKELKNKLIEKFFIKR